MGIPAFPGGMVCEETPCQRHGGSTTLRFREGAVRIVQETGKPIAEVARDLGIHAGTLGNWVKKDAWLGRQDRRHQGGHPNYMRQLERENPELRMERDVLKRSVVLWARRRRDEHGVVRRRPEDRSSWRARIARIHVPAGLAWGMPGLMSSLKFNRAVRRRTTT